MKVIDNMKKETINEVVKSASNATQVNTDDSTSNVDPKNFVPHHNSPEIPMEKVGEVLLWVHKTICDAKRQLKSTFHDIKPGFLQNYLDEFCYKFNRRYYFITMNAGLKVMMGLIMTV